MIYELRRVNGCTTDVAIPYSFLSPCSVKLLTNRGYTIKMGYGIGDKIYIMEPKVQYLVCSYKRWDKIPLKDGSFIVEYPDSIKIERMWNELVTYDYDGSMVIKRDS